MICRESCRLFQHFDDAQQLVAQVFPVDNEIKEAVLKKMRLNVHEAFTVAEGDIRLGAVLAEIDESTGKAVSCEGLWLPVPEGVA